MYKLWNAIVEKLSSNVGIISALGTPPRIRRQDNRTKVVAENGDTSQLNGIFFAEQFSRDKSGWDDSKVEDTDIEFIVSHSDMIVCDTIVNTIKQYWRDCSIHKSMRFFDPTNSDIGVLDSDITVDWGIKKDNDLKVFEGRIVIGIRWFEK